MKQRAKVPLWVGILEGKMAPARRSTATSKTHSAPTSVPLQMTEMLLVRGPKGGGLGLLPANEVLTRIGSVVHEGLPRPHPPGLSPSSSP